MSEIKQHPQWSSRFAFILAATGSAVGLGNIWKFPYITGENGGGAFVLVYLACIALIGLPVMIAEVMLGRRGRQNPMSSMQTLAQQEGRSSAWSLIGSVGIVTAFIILSFYSVIGGWALSYIVEGASSQFVNADTETVGNLFSNLLSSPLQLILWHSVFMLIVVSIVGKGIKSGMEKSINLLMPLLFILLLILVGYAWAQGEFSQGVSFLFAPDFSKLTTEGVLAAMGHAFFTLSIGMGVMMAYGSYLPDSVSIAKTAMTISILDTLVALLAGLAIFPLVFANGLEPSAGPGLIFQTLPLAFGQMSGGVLFATLFFALLSIAAITSGISVLEPVVELMEEKLSIQRQLGAWISGGLIWFLGLATVFSFNAWSSWYPLDFIPWFQEKTPFDIFDFLVTNLLMPLGGLAIVIFAGWKMNQAKLQQELELGTLWPAFYSGLRYITPVGILIVFIYNLL
ncbi:neurotransmitter:Na+ symporter, NSS family [Allopseudospirillum japonicum]|uniref:Transporter n=1 Tax=Allopseudospirillum japonicum TaxID=64971 RepID=A0A1H6QB12_9GAMM|nr:sodium-dependent transporter [Allopseudospirillum japonicum]SEI37357.1 neurotransmitter:Na+ symporter, NSS family [Allopseudospirillum japonicum]